MTEKRDLLPHYWICQACATERGGKIKKGVGSATGRTCPYCHGVKQGEHEYLFPTLDYSWPEEEK